MTVGESDPDLEHGAAAASIAILAGIAAADAACCSAVGRRSRSANHHDAAHYGFITLSAAELKRSLRQADSLISFVEKVVRGS